MATVELAVPRVVELLSPQGGYEIKRRELKEQLAIIVTESSKIAVITTQEELESATQFGRLLQGGLKEQESHFKVTKQAIDEIKKPVLQAEKDDAKDALAEKDRLGRMQTTYQAEQQRQARERQRLADEQARKDAEEEAILRAIEQELAGDNEAAEQILAEPVVAAPVVIQQQVERPKGAVQTTTFSCEVVNFMELVKAVANGRVPLHVLSFEQGKLNREAANYKEAFAFPGCKLKSETKTNYRS